MLVDGGPNLSSFEEEASQAMNCCRPEMLFGKEKTPENESNKSFFLKKTKKKLTSTTNLPIQEQQIDTRIVPRELLFADQRRYSKKISFHNGAKQRRTDHPTLQMTEMWKKNKLSMDLELRKGDRLFVL